ncbi:SGNH/GDSL hydrolase family protein [Phyllobacterium sp. 21LDTY02-6]|uniref:SGNH/GDSL hydrolase family protein n=1 Tax=unclassified Phyllobacterium TaxID=2638441 RepID=UPI00202033DF|nr:MULTISPECIES: SGNH/GDSL hydrolase family protein [unclassified Phyllobacterium]MCO4317562.1 SGNH/GDSL hydrolase family protein [Phyllobacterium sp. 21LDTY02-6]MCX8293061.1 SGNH/GDSL hydrolase family protein [Phyllobacterium sp. 0TCS1.6A]
MKPEPFHPLVSWLLFPLYAWQGLGVRRSRERLLPPTGLPVGEIAGKDPAIRLLVLGDSSAAGVGVTDAWHGICVRLAVHLQGRTGRKVIWRAAGFNSATSGQLRDHVVPNLERGMWTHIVLTIGTNDAKNFHSLPRFKRDFGGLLYAVRAKWPDAHIVWSQIIDFRDVPAMPPLLGRILEGRASAINALGTALCRERRAVPASRLPVEAAEGFSTDGFHASALGYDAWARHLVPYVLNMPDSEAAAPMGK